MHDPPLRPARSSPYGRYHRPWTPPDPSRRPPGGTRAERAAPRTRRLFAEARALHATASERLTTIDATIEALVDQRLTCLDVLVDCRDQLRPRWGTRHSRRRASVDEAPFPEAPPSAEPVDGVSLRAVAVTILRRHGPQRLRDLHGLIHLYGYRIASVRPVQRLGDAMAYELRCGRVERLERGVYGPTEDHPGSRRYPSPPVDLGSPLPWERPITEPGPPHLDPDVANDPELWSGGAWPTEHDLPPEPHPLPPDHDPAGPSGVVDPSPGPDAEATASEAGAPSGTSTTDVSAPGETGTIEADTTDAGSPSRGLGGDSPTNRRPQPPGQARRWVPPP